MSVHVCNNYQVSKEHDIFYLVVLSIPSSPFPSNRNSVNSVFFPPYVVRWDSFRTDHEWHYCRCHELLPHNALDVMLRRTARLLLGLFYEVLRRLLFREQQLLLGTNEISPEYIWWCHAGTCAWEHTHMYGCSRRRLWRLPSRI